MTLTPDQLAVIGFLHQSGRDEAVILVNMAFQAEAKLKAWEDAESLPDCPACAALTAAQEKP